MTTPAPWRPDRPVSGTTPGATSGPTAGSSRAAGAEPGPALSPASPGPGAGTGPDGNWFTRSGWWFLVHVLSFGFLSPIPFVHVATRTRRPKDVVVAIGYGLAVAVLVTLVAIAPDGPDGKPTGSIPALAFLVFLAVLVGGTVHLALLRGRVYRPAPRHSDPVIAAALAARDRREEARRLAAADPLLAREVRIGRPDLPRRYDDGGLVDLNTAPAAVLAQALGVDAAVAATIVSAREAAGRLTSVEDLFVYSDLPVDAWDVVRDRGIVLGP